MVKEGAPVLISFLGKIAARFGIEVSEKAAAQLIPVAGAAGGLALNVLFTRHFQRLAQGHFTIRRLERIYGAAEVREHYERMMAPQK
jgi:glycerate kinase